MHVKHWPSGNYFYIICENHITHTGMLAKVQCLNCIVLYLDEPNKTCLPVSNVIPVADFLVEALHGPHVSRALWKGQTGRRWLIGVVDVHKVEWQGQWEGCAAVGLGPPLTPRDDCGAV